MDTTDSRDVRSNASEASLECENDPSESVSLERSSVDAESSEESLLVSPGYADENQSAEEEGLPLELEGDGLADEDVEGCWTPGLNCGPFVSRQRPLARQGQVLAVNVLDNLSLVPIHLLKQVLEHMPTRQGRR